MFALTIADTVCPRKRNPLQTNVNRKWQFLVKYRIILQTPKSENIQSFERTQLQLESQNLWLKEHVWLITYSFSCLPVLFFFGKLYLYLSRKCLHSPDSKFPLSSHGIYCYLLSPSSQGKENLDCPAWVRLSPTRSSLRCGYRVYVLQTGRFRLTPSVAEGEWSVLRMKGPQDE